jgi:Spy/CpxP family protein refolding chaperone
MKQHVLRFATVAALAAGMAMAQAPATPDQPGTGAGTRQGPAARRGAMRQRLARQLNLTDAQKQQAKAIFEQAKQQAQPLAQQLKQNREALTAAVKANDTAQIHSLTAQQGTLRGQLMAIRSEAMAKFYTNLTPEQKAKADQLHQSMKQRMHQRNGNNG